MTLRITTIYIYIYIYIHARAHTHTYLKFKNITKLAPVLFTYATARGAMTFNITTYSIMTLRTVRLIITIIHTDMCYCYYESHCSECHYAECRHVECHGTHQGNKDIKLSLIEILFFERLKLSKRCSKTEESLKSFQILKILSNR